MKSLGVLTTIEANHGSNIFNYSLNKMLKTVLPEYDVQFLRYQPWGRFWYEKLRAIKPNGRIPFFNYHRYQRLTRHDYQYLNIVPLPFRPYNRLVKSMVEKKYDALISAKVVWDLSDIQYIQKFPNLFWLPSDIPGTKIAYAVSGHRTNIQIFRKFKDEIRLLLNNYSLIGVRDSLTMNMVNEAKIDQHIKIFKVPDPAFFFESSQLNKKINLIEKYGIAPDRPVLGLLLYGKPFLSGPVCEYYRSKGYQLINFNMYNPYVDINLGHKTDPFEWADFFKLMDFCITDRFHCSVFCIKNNVPFVAVEPYKPRSLLNSKIYDLLHDFDLTDCYWDIYADDFKIGRFLDHCEEMESVWKKSFQDNVNKKIDEAKARKEMVIELIKCML